MKRILIALYLLLSAVSAFAQKTPVPFALQQYLNDNGQPYDASGMCIYAAGTSTAATTYTTAAGSVANANPLMMSSAGRPASNGFFLTPGVSYKLVFVDYTGIAVPSCSPINGSTVWTQDNIEAVPSSTAVVDVSDATAGESITAGDAVFLSNGSCSLNAGQWYRTDSDLTCKSTYASMVGIAPSAINAGAIGSVRIYGPVTLAGPLNVGSPYYAGPTQGGLVTTPPTNAIRLGVAQGSTNFIVGYTKAPISPREPPCGRLTLTSGLPVTTSDVTAATTVYYTPAGSCNQIALYDGTAWSDYSFVELSIAVPATTATGYDVYAYDNAGVVTLELTAWTNLTTRATVPVLQNGVYVKTGALTRRFLGSFRTTGVSGQTEDSVTKRYVSNYYNRVRRTLQRFETTASWTYTTATVRQANGATANQVEIFNCFAGIAMDLGLTAAAVNDAGNSVSFGIGESSTTTYTGATVTNRGATSPAMSARLVKNPAIGGFTYSWNEWSEAAGGTSTFFGAPTSFGSTVSFGLRGWIEG